MPVIIKPMGLASKARLIIKRPFPKVIAISNTFTPNTENNVMSCRPQPKTVRIKPIVLRIGLPITTQLILKPPITAVKAEKPVKTPATAPPK